MHKNDFITYLKTNPPKINKVNELIDRKKNS